MLDDNKLVAMTCLNDHFKMLRHKRSAKTIVLFLVTGLLMIAINKTVIDLETTNQIIYEPINLPTRMTKIDWTDHEYLDRELLRQGLGEFGVPVILDDTEKDYAQSLVDDYSYNVLVSDRISLDRAIPDTRTPGCLNRTYYSQLPSASVIIIFHNEYLSVLLRTVHSVINRSPPQLLKEIILVDDFSDKQILGEPLDDHIRTHFPDKVRLLRLPKRSGLMQARMAGVTEASGDVVVIMDAHIEVNTNWLPPLLQPIADDYHTVSLAIIDYIDADTFQYRSSGENGYRGVFNWDMTYILLPRTWESDESVEDNYQNPVMLGAFFAISRDFFWELGGYDDQLQIWGAEQFELSFKIWMCGGRMITVPCSRAGHNFKGKGPHPFMSSSDGNNYVWRNTRRVVDTWLDEFKDLVYNKIPEVKAADPGDLTQQIALRQRLKCNSFTWYLNNVAPDVLKTFPVDMPADFASGTISSIAVPSWCIDTIDGSTEKRIGVYTCTADRDNPPNSQYFSLSFFRDIRVKGEYQCWDANPADEIDGRIPIKLSMCHTLQGNQFFRFDHINSLILADNDGTKCVEVDFTANPIPELFVADCNDTSITQMWEWSHVNETLLLDWDKYGEPL